MGKDERIAVIGLGLMGSSLGAALKRRRTSAQVVGWNRTASVCRRALECGYIDTACHSIQEAVRGSDLCVFCLPVERISRAIDESRDALAGCVVTDVGSTKRGVCEAGARAAALGGFVFVGSHPMAGSDASGIEAARADLYENATVVVTPCMAVDTHRGRAALDRIETFWLDVGAKVLRMSPNAHDRIVARTSHVPHMLASALAEEVLGRRREPETASLCGPGFRDMTRLAAGSDEIWSEIASANADCLIEGLRAVGRRIEELAASIERRDAKAVRAFLAEARRLRVEWNGEREASESASGKKAT